MRALRMALAALLLAACNQGVPPSPPGWGEWNGITPQEQPTPPPPLVGKADVTYVPEGARALSSVTSVEVRLRVSGLAGSASVDAEFLAPGPAAHDKRTLRVEALPTEERELVFSLPVAGTNLPVHGLSGNWEVRFFVDGAPLTTTSFTLVR